MRGQLTRIAVVIALLYLRCSAEPVQTLTRQTGLLIHEDITWFHYPEQMSSLTVSSVVPRQTTSNAVRFTHTATTDVDVGNYILLNEQLVNQMFYRLDYTVEISFLGAANPMFIICLLQIDGVYYKEVNTHYVQRDLTSPITIHSVQNLHNNDFLEFFPNNSSVGSKVPNFHERQYEIRLMIWIGGRLTPTNSFDYIIHSIRFDAQRPYRTQIPQCELGLLQPNINVLSRYIPEFTKLNHLRHETCRFVGFTAAPEYRVVFKDKSGALFEEALGNFQVDPSTYPLDLTSNPAGSEEFIYGKNSQVWPLDQFDSVWSGRYSQKVQSIYGLIDRLSSITIRGVNLYTVLEELSCHNGIYYPLAIVGGAIRDYLTGDTVADIDIATSIPYPDLVKRLQQIFVSRGVAIDETVLMAYGIRKQYGLIKVAQNSVLDPDALDIGPMKGERYYNDKNKETGIIGSPTGDSGLEKEIAQNYYSYGYSYHTDAGSRDYTVNAIYMELFGSNPKIIDVYGNGVEDNFNNIIRPTDSDNSVVSQSTDDLGGLFRYFKLRIKTIPYTPYDPTLPRSICKNLNNWLSDVEATNSRTETSFVIYKFMKKLFAPAMSSFSGTLDKIQNVITEDNEYECFDFWNHFVTFCQSGMVADIVATFNADSTENFRMNEVVNLMRQRQLLTKPSGGGAMKYYASAIYQTEPNERILSAINSVFPKLFGFGFRGLPNYDFGRTFGEYEDDAEEHPVVAYPNGTDFQLLDETTNHITYVHQIYLYATHAPSEGPLEPAMQSILEPSKFSFYAPQERLEIPFHALIREVAVLYHDEERLRRFASFVPTLRSSTMEKDFTDIAFRAVPDHVRAHRVVLLCRIPQSGMAAFGLEWNSMRELPQTIWLPSDRLPSTNGFNAFLDYVYTATYPAALEDEHDRETFEYLIKLSKIDTAEAGISGSNVMQVSSVFVILLAVFLLI